MTAQELHIRRAAQLYEMRDAARSVLGADYNSRMAEIVKILEGVSKKDGVGILEAAIAVCKKSEAQGVSTLLIMAAAVEAIERP